MVRSEITNLSGFEGGIAMRAYYLSYILNNCCSYFSYFQETIISLENILCTVITHP